MEVPVDNGTESHLSGGFSTTTCVLPDSPRVNANEGGIADGLGWPEFELFALDNKKSTSDAVVDIIHSSSIGVTSVAKPNIFAAWPERCFARM